MNDPTPRSDAKRKRHRKVLARNKPPCHWCGCELIFGGDPNNPRSFEADHVISVYLGGSDELDNKVASCRACNRARSWRGDIKPAAAVEAPKPPVSFVTTRDWWSADSASSVGMGGL